MKFSIATLLLLGSTDAARLQSKSTSQMQADIEAMSMNSNMHQVGLREKTLLKTYLQTDMNEFLQAKMDTELFEGVDEQHKSEFVGNFFHFVKCRFQDCGNLVQTKAKISTKEASKQPTIADTDIREKALDLKNWSSGIGNAVPAFNAKDGKPAPSHGTLVQLNQPTIADTDIREKALDLKNWSSGIGNAVPAFNSKDGKPAPSTGTLLELDVEKKERMTTNTSKQVAADLEKEKSDELVKPHAKADSSKDEEPK